MDKKILIDFKSVSKKYCLNLKRSLYYGMYDILKDVTGFSTDDTDLRKHEFLALDNVSFQVRKGESLGLVGHNGAGKTTSLKLINGLIRPNSGSIEVNGSIGALIALGVGFNPILTGRENVRVAGAVNGYTKKGIDDKFEEIIAFSEIGDFIDAPVQSYSSGMLARLGFSVAIHLNPDIMLVDEVLAVGDLNFVIKCFNKISDYRNSGGSMILVSHNMYNIRANCDKAVWIEHGKVQLAGDANKVCDEYEKYSAGLMNKSAVQGGGCYCSDFITLKSINYNKIVSDGKLEIELVIESKTDIEKPILSFAIFNMSNVNTISNTTKDLTNDIFISKGVTKINLSYDKLYLKNGFYNLNWVLASKEINNQLAASVNSEKFEVRNNSTYLDTGIFRLNPEWKIEKQL